MKFVTLVCSLLLVLSAHAGESFSLSAKGGEVNGINGPLLGTRGKVTTTLKVTEMSYDPKWAPTAILGFSQGAPRDRSNSIQFLLTQSQHSDDFMTFGYRLLERGVITEQKALARVELSAPMKLDIEFDKGSFTYRADGSAPITILTKLKEVRAYMSVNSGNAEFSDLTMSGNSNSQ